MKIKGNVFLSRFAEVYKTGIQNSEAERSFSFESKEDNGKGTSKGYVHYGTYGLLNIQVAIFAILQRKREKSPDSKIEKIENDELLARRELLGELNSNLSYLILFCCFSLVLFLVFYATDETSGISSAVSTIAFSHFVLTLLMIVKRSHALFQREYAKPNG